jgi:hypothetical protein
MLLFSYTQCSDNINKENYLNIRQLIIDHSVTFQNAYEDVNTNQTKEDFFPLFLSACQWDYCTLPDTCFSVFFNFNLRKFKIEVHNLDYKKSQAEVR